MLSGPGLALDSAVVFSCDQIGGGIGGPCDEVGGVVFSLSPCSRVETSLFERFMRAKTADKFVADFGLFGFLTGSSCWLGIAILRDSPLVLGVGVPFERAFDGLEGGDCTLPCRSPSARGFGPIK